MQEGDESWGFFEREHISDAAIQAVKRYGEAYDIHPRNREAVAALKKAASAARAAGSRRENRQALAKTLQKKSAFYEKYAPVVDAARE